MVHMIWMEDEESLANVCDVDTLWSWDSSSRSSVTDFGGATLSRAELQDKGE